MRVIANNGAEDDLLDDQEALQDQLDSLPCLCRCVLTERACSHSLNVRHRFQYEETSERLCSLIDPLVAAYAEALRVPGACMVHDCMGAWVCVGRPT